MGHCLYIAPYEEIIYKKLKDSFLFHTGHRHGYHVLPHGGGVLVLCVLMHYGVISLCCRGANSSVLT